MLLDRLNKMMNEVNPSLNAADATMETRLVEDIGLDSLNMMLLAVQVEDEFGFRFDDMPAFVTVGDLCAYIESKTGAAQ